MPPIATILKKLKPLDAALLDDAFDNLKPHWVEFEPGKFIGVHLCRSRHFQVEHRAGFYQAGRLHRLARRLV